MGISFLRRRVVSSSSLRRLVANELLDPWVVRGNNSVGLVRSPPWDKVPLRGGPVLAERRDSHFQTNDMHDNDMHDNALPHCTLIKILIGWKSKFYSLCGTITHSVKRFA